MIKLLIRPQRILHSRMLVIYPLWLIHVLNFKISLLCEKRLIVFIKKPGEDSSLARSYRPISLFPIIDKLIEHIFLTRLQNFIPNISEQFGFSPKHSAGHQLLKRIEYRVGLTILSMLAHFSLISRMLLTPFGFLILSINYWS